jgi:PII-like signaling protein
MRIYVGESDRCNAGPHRGKRLSEALLHTFRERGFAGVTLFRGIKGFGASGRLRTVDVEVLALDLPVVVEVVETEEAIQAMLPELDGDDRRGSRHPGAGPGDPLPAPRRAGVRAVETPYRGAIRGRRRELRSASLLGFLTRSFHAAPHRPGCLVCSRSFDLEDDSCPTGSRASAP